MPSTSVPERSGSAAWRGWPSYCRRSPAASVEGALVLSRFSTAAGRPARCARGRRGAAGLADPGLLERPGRHDVRTAPAGEGRDRRGRRRGRGVQPLPGAAAGERRAARGQAASDVRRPPGGRAGAACWSACWASPASSSSSRRDAEPAVVPTAPASDVARAAAHGLRQPRRDELDRRRRHLWSVHGQRRAVDACDIAASAGATSRRQPVDQPTGPPHVRAPTGETCLDLFAHPVPSIARPAGTATRPSTSSTATSRRPARGRHGGRPTWMPNNAATPPKVSEPAVVRSRAVGKVADPGSPNESSCCPRSAPTEPRVLARLPAIDGPGCPVRVRVRARHLEGRRRPRSARAPGPGGSSPAWLGGPLAKTTMLGRSDAITGRTRSQVLRVLREGPDGRSGRHVAVDAAERTGSLARNGAATTVPSRSRTRTGSSAGRSAASRMSTSRHWPRPRAVDRSPVHAGTWLPRPRPSSTTWW